MYFQLICIKNQKIILVFKTCIILYVQISFMYIIYSNIDFKYSYDIIFTAIFKGEK